MGKSDKPDIDYSFVDHSKYVEGFIEQMGLENLTLVVHDWGSALGFHYAMRNEANIKALAFMEAILMPFLSGDAFPPDARKTVEAFRTPDVGWDMVVNQHKFVEQVLPGMVVRKLTGEEMNHYRAPYTDPPSRKPLWRWVNEIPIAGEPANVVAIVEEYIRELAVPLIYLEEKRSFGGELDHAETRLRHYRDVIGRSVRRHTKLKTNHLTRMQPQPW